MRCKGKRSDSLFPAVLRSCHQCLRAEEASCSTLPETLRFTRLGITAYDTNFEPTRGLGNYVESVVKSQCTGKAAAELDPDRLLRPPEQFRGSARVPFFTRSPPRLVLFGQSGKSRRAVGRNSHHVETGAPPPIVAEGLRADTGDAIGKLPAKSSPRMPTMSPSSKPATKVYSTSSSARS